MGVCDFTFTFHFHAWEEEMAKPLQYSCLENPRDGRAWWAAVYEVTQGWTRLKRLSSSSSSKGMVSLFFWNEKIGRLFLFTLVVFPNQLISRHHQFTEELIDFASSLSLSPSSSVCAVGLASEQTEMSKEERPGNQRDDYSQMTKQRGFRYGLCCHWSKREK